MSAHQPSIADRVCLACRLASVLVISCASIAAASPQAETPAKHDSQPPLVALPDQPAEVPWPTGRWPESDLDPNLDRAALESAIERLFAPIGRGQVPDSRALLIVQHGKIVAERYSEGFDADSRFHTWSLAKSLTQALIGILVHRGVLALDEPVPIPQWQSKGDPRAEITLRQMLNMTSGIANQDFPEDANGPGDFVRNLLFGAGAMDATAYAADAELTHPPGTHWAYSTATTNLLAGVIGRAVAEDAPGRAAFIQTELLAPIGAEKIIFEFDLAGHFMGGSHLYGRARDFARIGLLYMRDGVWDGSRILPEGWVDFSRRRAPAENNGNHGAHFWLNLPPKASQFNLFPGRPVSIFEASGNNGQLVIIVPTNDLIIVRLGEMQTTNWDEMNASLASIIDVFLETQPEDPRQAYQRGSE